MCQCYVILHKLPKNSVLLVEFDELKVGNVHLSCVTQVIKNNYAFICGFLVSYFISLFFLRQESVLYNSVRKCPVNVLTNVPFE